MAVRREDGQRPERARLPAVRPGSRSVVPSPLSRGDALDPATRSEMESAFQHSLADVRVHADVRELLIREQANLLLKGLVQYSPRPTPPSEI